MRLNIKGKLFLRFGCLFLLFFAGVILIGQWRQRTIKKQALEDRLAEYVSIIDKAAPDTTADYRHRLGHILPLLPRSIRVSIIDHKGVVLFDNVIDSSEQMQNHSARAEVVAASRHRHGTDIRISQSDGVKYLYLAEKIGSRFIRVALPYNTEVRYLLRMDAPFFYWAIALLAVTLLLIGRVAHSTSGAVRRLRDLAINPDTAAAGETFPDDELGEVSRKIARNYQDLREKTQAIDYERERLAQHVLYSREGVCFFTPAHEVLFFNGLFVQYLHAISDCNDISAATLAEDPLFAPVFDFVKGGGKTTSYESRIRRHGKAFSLRAGVFEDGGFEMVLNDVTENEKMHRIKQEMTGNIAHELRTPVTSIRGYLETLLEQNPDQATREYFLQQAYHRTLALSDLIHDISLITKLDESTALFKLSPINLSKLLERVGKDFASDFTAHRISFRPNLPSDTVLTGNESLLYAIFRNLTENAIRYGGENIQIIIDLYRKDEDYLYFSFYDTGVGISDESHLTRLFERFYRVHQGRTRETGGTGLGLSIVKNAVLFHKGEITVKNRSEGGLEFLFRLKRTL
ncbi:hypothetical protein HR17_00660 [Porphyromonas gulae]|uniref:sensor histidine kinase n=1 Tax=Porphyromonas gulae TaxID=111105 RepID=UPI00052DC05C|nr:ATP-binding protein [Porphyromonas gulae]KGN77189.1 hypothetical protein HR17_00660 [Porphyromonas gulae]